MTKKKIESQLLAGMAEPSEDAENSAAAFSECHSFVRSLKLKESNPCMDIAIAAVLSAEMGRVLQGEGAFSGLEGCESPIEEALGSALAVVGRWEVDELMVGGGRSFGSSPTRLAIHPQVEVYEDGSCGYALTTSTVRYRTDFMVTYRNHEHPPLDAVVECDGHEFHQKTKEQASSDYRRDRWLTRHGYTVLRFTGSEIWHDPISCAREVVSTLSSISRKRHGR